MGRGKCLHENKHTLEKNCDNFHDLYYSSYYDLNNSQNLSIYCKSLYRTIVLGKKPRYVHSQIQCKQAKLWKTSTALTYDKHLGVHWFLFTKILFPKKKKDEKRLLPDSQKVRQHFRDEVPTKKIKFSIKMLTTLTKNSNFTQDCMAASINVDERSISYCRKQKQNLVM